jgi:hypothetical protein
MVIFRNKKRVIKRIAKECLYFLGLLAFGIFVVPLIIFFALGPSVETTKLSKFYNNFYDALHENWGAGVDFWFALSSVWFPYLFFQFIRTVIWIRRTVRTKYT